MGKISETGLGLTVRINCEELSNVYDWLSFATWYACCRSLPDANFCLSMPKPSPGNYDILFRWLDRCKIKKVHPKSPVFGPTLVLKPQTIQFRGFYPEEIEEINSGITLVGNGIELIQNSKSVKRVDWLGGKNLSENAVFLVTNEKVGNVDVREWAAKSRDPIFAAVWAGQTHEEKFIQPLWQKMGIFYAMTTR